MFNNKTAKKVNGSSSAQSPSLNMISEGTNLKGTLNSENDIRIAGKIDGEAISKGKLIITSTGVVKGDARVTDADIAGKIEGNLRVSGKLNLRQTAVINGDIYTKTLVVEEGAQINGSCHMGAEVKAQVNEVDNKRSVKIKTEDEK
ncbi:MAG: polymer-forming cytoskeletal protein [Balneolaceae bacterium]|nr:MAG: polymer-forming cytoskeletal protein [Balneolaceae bacterium]